MIERIILDIKHSDDYTDYLFQTAALKNKRVIPLVDPFEEDMLKERRPGTHVIWCSGSNIKPSKWDKVVSMTWTGLYGTDKQNLTILSKSYLNPDGSINFTKADEVRLMIEEEMYNILFAPRNLEEVYGWYFPKIWDHRQEIYANPHLFYIPAVQYNEDKGGFYPIGVVLKAIEESGDLFRMRLDNSCRCKEKPILTYYSTNYGDWFNTSWTLHTWCPECGKRIHFPTGDVLRKSAIDKCYKETFQKYDKGIILSKNIFDLIDSISK